MSGRSRANVRKRGETYTYYVYVTQPDGRRRQVSRGGFRTRREAEAARVEALNAIQTGTFVRPERITVAGFLLEEWLPTRRPPNLEESTYASYERDIHLHVVPYIGSIPLQKLTPTDLNTLYRRLLDEGRCPPRAPSRRHPPELMARAAELRAQGRTYEAIAEHLVARTSGAGPRHHTARGRRVAPTGSVRPLRQVVSAGRPQAPDREVRPHDRACRSEGRAALEPGRPQRCRCCNAAAFGFGAESPALVMERRRAA